MQKSKQTISSTDLLLNAFEHTRVVEQNAGQAVSEVGRSDNASTDQIGKQRFSMVHVNRFFIVLRFLVHKLRNRVHDARRVSVSRIRLLRLLPDLHPEFVAQLTDLLQQQ